MLIKNFIIFITPPLNSLNKYIHVYLQFLTQQKRQILLHLSRSRFYRLHKSERNVFTRYEFVAIYLTHCNLEVEYVSKKSVGSRGGACLVVDEEAEPGREQARAQQKLRAGVPAARHSRRRLPRVAAGQRAPRHRSARTLVCNPPISQRLRCTVPLPL